MLGVSTAPSAAITSAHVACSCTEGCLRYVRKKLPYNSSNSFFVCICKEVFSHEPAHAP